MDVEQRSCALVDAVFIHLGDDSTDDDCIDFVERAVNKAIAEDKHDKAVSKASRWKP